MYKQEIMEEARKIIEDFFAPLGFELVDIIYRYEAGSLFLRLLADRPEGGITLEECAGLNRELSAILDEKEIPGLSDRYILEVSSPGLDRPLRTKKDFLRCVNRKAKFFLNEPIDGRLEIDGVINRADDLSVYVSMEGRIIPIPLSRINKARQLLQ